MIKTAVVILNWNGEKFLQQFLPSVAKYSNSNDVEIFVADNGSSDNSISYIKKNFDTVKILQFDKNYGFTGGYNRALTQIEAKFYVLLNSDVEVCENWINPIIEFMEKNTDVAACMPKLLTHSKPTHFEYAGAVGGFIDKYGYPFCRGRILSEIEEDTGQYNTIKDIFWASGACMFVRASLFHTVGGFDDDFFAHMEEIDLCWRLKNAGYRIVSFPQVAVLHVGGGTLPNNNPHKLFLNFRNNLLMLYKNLPEKELMKTLVIRMLYDGMAAVLYLLKGEYQFFKAVLKAHLAFYKMRKQFKIKRTKIKQEFKLLNHKQIYNQSIVWNFFLNKKRKFSDYEKELENNKI